MTPYSILQTSISYPHITTFPSIGLFIPSLLPLFFFINSTHRVRNRSQSRTSTHYPQLPIPLTRERATSINDYSEKKKKGEIKVEVARSIFSFIFPSSFRLVENLIFSPVFNIIITATGLFFKKKPPFPSIIMVPVPQIGAMSALPSPVRRRAQGCQRVCGLRRYD